MTSIISLFMRDKHVANFQIMTTAERNVKTEKPGGRRRRQAAWQLEFEIEASIKRRIPFVDIYIYIE